MRIPFHKVHGLQNDLVLIDAIDRADIADRGDWSELGKAWCQRHAGIGADAVLVLTGPGRSGTDARLRILNPDGGEVEMCGNGLRCVARHLYEVRGWGERDYRVETGAGVIVCTPQVEAGRFVAATVDMGRPVLKPGSVPVEAPGERAVDMPLPKDVSQAWQGWGHSALLDWRFTCVSMGNPHAVLFCDAPANVPLTEAGPVMERHPIFPRRSNVHFVRVKSTRAAEMVSWERGAGVTRACGSGACAVAVAGVLTGRLGRACEIRLPGGELKIEWDEASDHVRMTGTAVRVYEGHIEV